MSTEWKPGQKVQVLRGWPSLLYGKMMIGASLSIAIFAILLGVSIWISGEGWAESRLSATLFLLAIIAILADAFLVLLLRRREKAEVARGYTTLRGDHQDVGEVEVDTGYVIRMPGEPYLPPDERRRRMQIIRSAAMGGNEDRPPGICE